MALKTSNAIQLQTIVTIDEKVLLSTLIGDDEETTHKRVVNVKIKIVNAYLKLLVCQIAILMVT